MQLKENREFMLPNEIKLIIYGRDTKFKYPKNCVITDVMGEIKFIVEAPKFKSNKMIEGVKNELHSSSNRIVWTVPPHKKTIKNFWGKIVEEVPEQGFIDKYIGIKKINNEDYAEMIISDGAEFFETQYLDIKTGKFIDIADWGGRF